MDSPRDWTPIVGTEPPDPDQLTLGGGLDASVSAPPIPVRESEPTDAADGAVAVREPPVCGEWSFDMDELPDARAGATFVPTPAVAQVVIPPPRLEPRAADGGARAAAPAGAQAPRRPTTSRMTPPTPLPALDELKSIHDAHPGDEQTVLALANALAKRGNIEGALAALQRAIDAGADTVTLRCARATILSGRLRYDDAEVELKRAHKAKPDDTVVLLQQGILACRRAKWREAVEPLARVVKHDPTSAPAHFYLGEALSKLDRLGEALGAYRRAAELEPDNWRAFKGVGIVLDRLGRPGDAAEFYRRARDGQRGP